MLRRVAFKPKPFVSLARVKVYTGTGPRPRAPSLAVLSPVRMAAPVLKENALQHLGYMAIVRTLACARCTTVSLPRQFCHRDEGKGLAIKTDCREGWPVPDIRTLPIPEVRQLIFWPANQEFPLSFTARHIWSKCNVCVGEGEPYEAIFERFGKATGLVYRHSVINCQMNATLNGDIYTSHPTQKPIRLMRALLRRIQGVVLDPFMGSGSTGVAAMETRRHFIGIEQSRAFFDIACERIELAQRQSRLFEETGAKRQSVEQQPMFDGSENGVIA